MKSNQMPKPIYFVSPELDLWPELKEGEAGLDPQDITSDRLSSVDSCWIIMTFLNLKRRGQNVFLVDKLVPGEICIVDVGYFYSKREYITDSYIVAARGDCSRSSIANFSIVQNSLLVKARNDLFIPHWPQPGLIPRDPKRKENIERITFKGAKLNEDYKSEQFMSELSGLGIELRLDQKNKDGQYSWNDYSDCDLVLAVRDQLVIFKPASKLVNAWAAGVPALLGIEPAYRELKKSHLDFIEISSPKEVIDTIRTLKKNPDLYKKMVDNGCERAKDFTFDSISKRWLEALYGPIYNDFICWQKQTRVKRKIDTYIRIIKQHYVWKKFRFFIPIISFAKNKLNIKSYYILKQLAIWQGR